MRRQPQGEGHRPLLALRGMGSRRAARRWSPGARRGGARPATPPVAARRHGRPRAPPPGHARATAPGTRSCTSAADAADLVVGLRQHRRESIDQLARASARASPASTSLVSHTASVDVDVGAEPPAAPLEQGVALAQHPIEVAADHIELRLAGHQRVVEVATAPGGAALHQIEVVRREHRHPQRARQIAARASRCLLTCTRPRPVVVTSASTRS